MTKLQLIAKYLVDAKVPADRHAQVTASLMKRKHSFLVRYTRNVRVYR